VERFEPVDEAREALPERLRDSRIVDLASRLLQAVCIGYAAFLLLWIWLAKGIAVDVILRDPVFSLYSMLVTVYCVTRFLLAPFSARAPTAGTGLQRRSSSRRSTRRTASGSPSTPATDQVTAGGRSLSALVDPAGLSLAGYRHRVESDLDKAQALLADATGAKPVRRERDRL
jgi:hypothetical protein